MTESTVVVEPPCGFKSVQSKDDICTTQKEIAESGSDLETGVFNSTLLPPFYYLVAYIAVLKYMTDHLRQEAARYPETDVFKSVWWSSPIFFTVFYLSAVFIGVHVMKDRKEMKIKPYIFTYNLYQCVLNLGGVIAMVMEVYTNPWYKAPWGNFPQPGNPSM